MLRLPNWGNNEHQKEHFDSSACEGSLWEVAWITTPAMSLEMGQHCAFREHLRPESLFKYN